MSNINVIVTNINDVHRILDSFERKKRGNSSTEVYPKKYKTPVTKMSDYLVQHDHPLTLEGFLEERNKLVMRLDENSRKRLLETRHPPQFQYPPPQFYPPNLYDANANANNSATPERGQQQQQKKQPQQQQYQTQQQQYQPQSSPDLFRGLDIGDIDESLNT